MVRVGDFLALLAQEAATYRRLLDTLRDEEAALLAGRSADVAACTSRKETLLLELRVLSESRGVLLSRLAELYDVPTSALTLSRLTDLVDQPEADQLREVRTTLTETLSQMAQASYRVGLLLERSLFRIRETLRLVRESLGFAPQYDPAGRLLTSASPILDQEA
ncbi:MAG: flagellar protein FlgN [Candidatus Methylomirabilia bacterium]